MRHIIDILSILRAKGINISLDEVELNLKVRGDIHKLSEDDRAQIKKNKTELVNFLRKQKNDFLDIPVEETEDDEFELSPNQKSIWVHEKIAGNKMLYVIPALYELNFSDFEQKNFLRALEFIVSNHEILRTVFGEHLGEPYQKILSSINIKEHFHVVDLEESPNATEEMKDKISKNYNLSFNLTLKPLWEISLFLLPEGRVNLFLKIHHLISDGESMNLITKFILNVYNGNLNNIPFSKHTLQYRHFAKWINNKKNFETSSEFWKREFSNFEERFSLPTISDASQKKSHEGAEYYYSISEKLSNNIVLSSEKKRLHISTLFTSAFAIVLSKISRCNDFVIGIPSASRNHPLLQSLIGNCVNILPLRIQIDYLTNKSNFLDSVQQKYYEVLEHQHYSLQHILEDVFHSRNNNTSPLFNVVFSFPNVDNDLAQGRENGISRNISLYDLTFTVINTRPKIQIIAEYNTAIFNKTFVESITTFMIRVMEQFLDGTDESISGIKLLSEHQEEEIRIKFCKKNNIIDVNSHSIINLIQRQVGLKPDKIAINSKIKEITYSELWTEVILFRQYLTTLGVVNGERVTVLLRTSEYQIITMLGIMLTGGIYVPIDPLFPEERVTAILNDCKPKIEIDDEFILKYRSIIRGKVETNAFNELISIDPAYILYTSGSSGRPKGVLISHGNLVNKISELESILKINDATVTVTLTNPSFDVSFLETLLPLCFGGEIYIPSLNLELSNFDALIDELVGSRVSIIQGTPTWFSNFISDINDKQSISLNQFLKYICIGGESLNGSLIKRMKQIFPSVNINNHYGPTETTIDAVVNENLFNFETNIIGEPIGNTEVYVLDEQQNILPLGIQGELCIAGPSVAIGYWNDDKSNSTKFKMLPFCQTPLYFTGDIVRWTEDAKLEFIRRNDEQIKLRGYRIELQEINKALLNCQGIVDAYTQIVGNTLKSWVVQTDDFSGDIINELEKKIPLYMIPSSVTRINKMPLTSNGKLDKVFFEQQQLVNVTYVAPRTEMEAKLVKLWEEVLNIADPGVKDHFFELGGDSLKIIKIIVRIREHFSVELNLEEVFRNPTIEGISKLITRIQWVSFSAEQNINDGITYTL